MTIVMKQIDFYNGWSLIVAMAGVGINQQSKSDDEDDN